MKNAAKRLVALLLALSMALSLLSTSAWATNAVDELTESLPVATEQEGDVEAPAVDEPAAEEPEDVPAEAPEEGVEEPETPEEPAANEETTPDDDAAVPQEGALNTEEPADQEEADAAPELQIDLSRIKFNVPSYGDMLASTALNDVDENEIKIDENDPIMASISEELDEIVVTSEPDSTNGEGVLNGDGEGTTEEKVPLTEEQKQTVLYLFQQYLNHWEENADVLGVQTPFFLWFNDDEDELGGLGEMLVLAGESVENVRNGNYGYDDLVGMIQNFTYGNQYGVEYYGDTVEKQRDAALQAVEDSGAKTDIQKLLVLNDWLAQEDTFEMAYIMNMSGTEMKAEKEVKNEHYDTMYNAIYAQYEDSIEQQFHDQIYAGIEASLRQQYYEAAIKQIVYQNAYDQAIENGADEETAKTTANTAAEQYMTDNADAISEDAPGFVEENFGEEAAAQLSAGADDFIETAETEGVEVDPENAPGVKMTIEQLTQQQMDQPLDDLNGMTPNEAVPVYAEQAATGMTDGIIGYWQGSQFGALALGASVCLGYSKAYAYLVQCEFADLYTTDGNYKNASSWKKAADLYYDADGNLDINQNYNVDMVRITYEASVTMYGEKQDSFNSDHFWNAVKINGKWYYIDPCYADVYIEVMSQDRVETTGNMNHMYFLFSDTSARSLYDGNFSELKSLYENVATDTTYEDAWVSRIKSNTSFDGDSAYYLYDSTDVIGMMGQFGGMGGLNRSSEIDSMGLSSSEYKIVKHDLSAADADDGDTDYETLIEFNYKADEDDDTTVARVYNPSTKAMEENEMLTELFAQFQYEQTIYPSIALTMALYNDKIYFNLSNGIFSYDLGTGEVVEVKEYNDVYAQRDTTVAFGGMAFTVIDESDYKEGDVHYQKVENAPIAGLTIKDDGKLYVDIATKYAYISGKSDINDSSSYGYEFQESNYNPSYNKYFNDDLGSYGYEKEVNDNDEFMWSAVFHDSVAMSTVTGSHTYETVTVAPTCDRDGYTEERSTNWGVIKADSRVYDEGSAYDHHYVHFDETYYTKDDSGNWNTGDCYVCTICGYAVEEDDDGSDDDWDETKDTYEMAKAKAGHVYSPVNDSSVTWDENYTSATVTNADLVCDTCDDKALDCLQNDKTITLSGQNAELTEVTSKLTGTCDKGLTTTYTATGTTSDGKAVTATKVVETPAGVHHYEGEFSWAEDYSSATVSELTCTVCGDKQTGEKAAVITKKEIDPTCEEDGQIVYTATVTVKDDDGKELGTATDTKSVTTDPALGHDYEASFQWAEDYKSAVVTLTCKHDSTHVVTSDSIEAEIGESSATCTTAGTVTYTVTYTYEDKDYTDSKTVEVEALGHDFGEPEFTWNGVESATATFTCTRCGEKETTEAVNAVKDESKHVDPDCETAGKDVYVVTITFEGKEYTDTKEQAIAALGHDYDEQGVCKRCGAIQTLDTPVVLSATNSATGVTVKWQKVTNATGYRVFRKAEGGKWAALPAAKNVTATSFVDTTAKSGTKYYYTVRAYRGDKDTANDNAYKTPYWSAYNKTGKSVSYIAAPKVTVSNVAKGVKVSWGKVNGAVKYRVFRKTANGSWKKLKDVTTTSYKDTTAKAGTTYVYTVRCINKKGTAYTSSYNATGKTIARLATTSISSLKNAKSKKMTVKWKKNAKATGYVIEYSTNKNFTKNVVQKNITKKTTVSKTISGLKKGTKYYVRIRAYKTVSGTKYYSAWSAVKNLKITK